MLLVLLIIISVLNITVTSCRICIIGGGLAGLSAAETLSAHDIDYVLLEAADRLGGRIYPIQHDNQTIQLGAEWINGENNEMYRIAKKLGILSKKVDDFGIYRGHVQYALGRHNLNMSDLQAWRDFVNPLLDKYTVESETKGQLSVGERLKEDYETWIQDHLDNRRLFDALLKLYESEYESEWSAPVEELALENFKEWDDDSNDDAAWELHGDGFKDILQDIISRIPSERIQLNAEVRKIDWQVWPVQVHIFSGDIIECSSVIITVPLGVLKAEQTVMFNPALPTEKQEVIRKLGFGSLEKIFLQYDQPWWNTSANSIITLRIKGEVEKGNDIMDAIRTLQPVNGRPNMLLLWLSKKGPLALAGYTQEKFSQYLTKHFREVFGNESIPEPVNIHGHRWLTDPFTRGAYSYITPESYGAFGSQCFEVMARKVKNNNGRAVLFFAGEHTHSSLFQTTSGAYESGKREATKVIHSIKITTDMSMLDTDD